MPGNSGPDGWLGPACWGSAGTCCLGQPRCSRERARGQGRPQDARCCPPGRADERTAGAWGLRQPLCHGPRPGRSDHVLSSPHRPQAQVQSQVRGPTAGLPDERLGGGPPGQAGASPWETQTPCLTRPEPWPLGASDCRGQDPHGHWARPPGAPLACLHAPAFCFLNAAARPQPHGMHHGPHPAAWGAGQVAASGAPRACDLAPRLSWGQALTDPPRSDGAGEDWRPRSTALPPTNSAGLKHSFLTEIG